MASVENPRFGKSQRREIEETIDFSSAKNLDSGECGERKRIRGIGKIMSRQVLEFKDTYGIYAYYNGKKSVEREDFKYVDLLDEYLDSDDEEEIRNSTFPREDVLKHLKQARESFGFDVDVDIPMWLGFRHYIPIDLSGGYDREGAYTAAEFAIQEINADMDSKSYELVEVVSNVFVDHYCLNYLTLTAKKVGEVVTIQAIVRCHRNGNCLELEQWRFKPDA